MLLLLAIMDDNDDDYDDIDAFKYFNKTSVNDVFRLSDCIVQNNPCFTKLVCMCFGMNTSR